MRGYNFGAGPAMLPESILQEVREELLDWNNMGMSILELGHRTPAFISLLEQTEALLRELLTVPDDYHVLFLGGAARLQFAMTVLNFLAEGEQAGYLVTGLWSLLAYQEAHKLKKAYCVANGENKGFTDVPAPNEWEIKENTKYFYYTPNETVNGIRVTNPPQLLDMPIIADMTSCLFSEPIDVRDYDLIFAGAQKNIANAGLTIVIVRDAFLQTMSNDKIPTMLDYRTFSSTQSTYATLPTFNCYLANKMFHWIKARGGVETLYKINCQKAAKIYDCIDNSNFYHCRIAQEARSLVNICFSLDNPILEEAFLEGAKARGLLALKGHRTVGGLRASLYNAMPMEGVEQLIRFMNDFAEEHRP